MRLLPLFAVAFLAMAMVSMRARAQVPESRRTIQLKAGPHAGETFPYVLISPAALEPNRRYPLVMFLHGAGERGSDPDLALTHIKGPLLSEKARRDWPCFVLAPQCPLGRQWVDVPWDAKVSTPAPSEPSFPMQLALECLSRTIAENPVDLDRVYLTGLSMGGFGSWDLAVRHPEWFAAVAPICGGGDERLAHRLVGVPLWTFHGSDDKTVWPVRSRQMVDAIHAAGGDARLTELPSVGHDSWRQAYGEGGVIPWMFGQRRPEDGGVARALGLLTGAHSPVKKGAKIAFLGDSITESGAGPGGYVTLISEAFAAHADLGVQVIGAGVSGNRVPNLLARVQHDVIDRGATVVFVYIGINDVWHRLQGRGTPENEFESGLRDLVSRLEASGAVPILATPSVIGEKRAGTNDLDAALDTYAAITRRVAAERHLHVCDLRRAFQDHLRVFNAKDAAAGVLTSDGVHLTPAGNRFVAREAARALFEALK